MNDRGLIVIARPGSSIGFALAGLEVATADDARSAMQTIEELDARVGVVIIDEHLYRGLTDEFRQDLNRSAEPVVIPVPGPDWAEGASAHEYVVEILRRAIGYRVKL
jgi:vacuolar-type H+-ATPase subunit F/Vma7